MAELKSKRTRGTTKRLEDTGYYTHPWVQKLSKDGIYLYKYLFSNTHCNQAGLYKISIETICFETKILKEELPDILKELGKNVQWWPDIDLLWVKEFLYENKSSITFLTAAVSCLAEIKQKEIVREFVEYNLSEHDITLDIKVEATKREQIKTDDFKVAGMIKYYEDNLGRMLTPNDLDKLKDYADTYPDGWFEKAVDEAKIHGAKAPMRYMEKIMETWLSEYKSADVSGDNQGIKTI